MKGVSPSDQQKGKVDNNSSVKWNPAPELDGKQIMQDRTIADLNELVFRQMNGFHLCPSCQKAKVKGTDESGEPALCGRCAEKLKDLAIDEILGHPLAEEAIKAMNAKRLNRSSVKPGMFRSVTGAVIFLTVLVTLWIIGVAGAFLRWW